jgi:hypothetical protein
MENTNTIHFRKSGNDLIAVTEQNTKITYTTTKHYELGRLVVEFERVCYRKTAQARFNYFMYNNRIARFKRALMPFISRHAAKFGLHLYMTS